MDIDKELARFQWMLFAGIAFLVSGIYSFNELRYAVWSKTAEANVLRVNVVDVPSRRSTKKVLRVEYEFSEADGTSRHEVDGVHLQWPVKDGDVVKVQYLAGVEDSSRLLGHSNMLAVYIFLGCLGLLGFSIYKLFREANEPIISKPRRRQKKQ